jgi:hypothetical protein
LSTLFLIIFEIPFAVDGVCSDDVGGSGIINADDFVAIVDRPALKVSQIFFFYIEVADTAIVIQIHSNNSFHFGYLLFFWVFPSF